jgi:hypothetical protein
MAKAKDLTGQKFDRLTVIERDFSRKGTAFWLCLCECGAVTSSASGHLISGRKRSCGCYKKEVTTYKNTTHGMADTPEYNTWCLIKKRCYDKNCRKYLGYGGRGIFMYEPWITDFQAFYDHIGRKPSGSFSIDRIINSRGYFPGNIRWATPKEQGNNTRNNVNLTYLGKTQTIAQWAVETCLPYEAIRKRLERNWSVERALTEPLIIRKQLI